VMLRSVRACTIFLAGLIFSGVTSSAHAVFVTNLSAAQIQQVLNVYFPMREYAAFARVSLHSPQVKLTKEDKNIILLVSVEAKVAGGAVHRGSASIEVGLSYKAAVGGLYLSQPRIRQFEIPGAEQKLLADLREIVQSMGRNLLPVIQIYRVKERDLNHSLTKSVLKSYAIEDGQLRLAFGFN
jgi:Protein of unknown function (DUF1439)